MSKVKQKKALIVTTLGKKINNSHLHMITPLKMLDYEITWAANFNLLGDFDIKNVEKEVHVYNVEFSRNPLSYKNFSSYKKLLKYFKDGNNYDLIHVNTPVAAFITRKAAHKARVKSTIIYTAHGFHFFKGSGILGKVYRFLEKRMINKTDKIILMNNEDYNNAKKMSKNNNIKIYKIPGVGLIPDKDTSRIDINKIVDDLDIDTTRKTFISIGELNKNKNHMTVLKAMKVMENKEFNYLICGAGPQKKKILKFIKKHSLSNVKLLGFRDDVNELLNISSLLIHFSKREGLPRVIMEAQAVGVPSIVSNIRGNVDLVEDYSNGFIVRTNNYRDLSVTLDNYLDGQLLFNKNSKDLIEDSLKFSSENVYKKMIEIYNDI